MQLRQYDNLEDKGNIKFTSTLSFPFTERAVMRCVVLGRHTQPTAIARKKFWSNIPLYNCTNLSVYDYIKLIADHHGIPLIRGYKVYVWNKTKYFDFNIEKVKESYTDEKLFNELQTLKFQNIMNGNYVQELVHSDKSVLLTDFFQMGTFSAKNLDCFLIVHKIQQDAKKELWDLFVDIENNENQTNQPSLAGGRGTNQHDNKDKKKAKNSQNLISPYSGRKEIKDLWEKLQSGGAGEVYDLNNVVLPDTPKPQFNTAKLGSEKLRRLMASTVTRCNKVNGTVFQIRDTIINEIGHGFFISPSHLVTCIHNLRLDKPDEIVKDMTVENELYISFTNQTVKTNYKLLYPKKLNETVYNDFDNLDVAILELDLTAKVENKIDIFDTPTVNFMKFINDAGIVINPNHPSLQPSVIYYYDNNDPSTLNESIH
ncbi:predicted protein, partial [Naegleria gruberi]